MTSQTTSLLLIALTLILLAIPSEAFGAGYVAPGSHLKGTKFRHGDIALAIPLLATANRRIVKQIYFGNWLRDFSQLLDKGSLSLVPRPLLRALVAIFAFVQFGYATREFEVTNERLGLYRPEEHVDNPKGYDSGTAAGSLTSSIVGGENVANHQTPMGLRPPVHPPELYIDPSTGMKNYIANSSHVGRLNPTSADYVEKQLIAAIACGRQGDQEAYIHLGAALHALEDFLAHSNYVELAMQLIGREIQDQTKLTPALRKVFAFVGEGARVKTAQGDAPPMTTGTFGALDLCQTLLGEIEDKTSALSLPGLEIRTQDDGGALQKLAKYVIGLLGGLTPDFELDVLKIQKSAAKAQPTTWGELEEKPEKLWDSIEPVFKLRDDVAKWINDHLKIRAVQDALASISTAIDKLVYMVLGIFLSPLLTEFSKVLKDQEQRLLLEDQNARRAMGEQSIFSTASTSTDPTHSQLAKDHYDHALNEIAGRIAVRVSTHTTAGTIQLWQPGNTQDPRKTIQSILEVFHHPFNSAPSSIIQSIMLDEVRGWIRDCLNADAKGFESTLHSLSTSAVASRMNVHDALPGGHTHVDAATTVPKDKANSQNVPPPAQQRDDLMQRMTENIKHQLNEGKIKGVGIDDFPEIEKLLFAAPSGESPNPLDSGLSKIPGLNFLSTFQGVGIGQIAAVEGMGETLKDAVVTMILLDETRGAEEEEVAATRFGWGKTVREKEERARLRELRSLLEIKRTETGQEEGQFDEKASAGEKIKLQMEKLKLKASR